ncbi:hypothetical protein D1872_294900 [compost metagenome]
MRNADVGTVPVADGGNQLRVILRPFQFRILDLNVRMLLVEGVDHRLHIVAIATGE